MTGSRRWRRGLNREGSRAVLGEKNTDLENQMPLWRENGAWTERNKKEKKTKEKRKNDGGDVWLLGGGEVWWHCSNGDGDSGWRTSDVGIFLLLLIYPVSSCISSIELYRLSLVLLVFRFYFKSVWCGEAGFLLLFSFFQIKEFIIVSLPTDFVFKCRPFEIEVVRTLVINFTCITTTPTDKIFTISNNNANNKWWMSKLIRWRGWFSVHTALY